MLLPRHKIGVILGMAATLLLLTSCRQGKRMPLNMKKDLPPVALKASLEPGEATIGDRINYILSLNHEPGIAADLPEVGTSLEGLTQVGSGHSRPKSEAGRISEKKWIIYRSDRIGTWIFPSVTMHYRQNGVDKEINTGEITLNVKSVLSPQMADIHGIKPLEDAGRNFRLFFIAAALAVFLILLALGAWLYRKRRKKPASIPPPLQPDQEAIESLQKLADMGLINKGEFKKHCFLLSDIFRRYIERRFAFPAVERTSEEISGALAALNLTDPLRNHIRTFLDYTDPVKFGQTACTMDEVRAVTDRVRLFVAETARQNPLKSEEEHVAV